MFFRTYEFNSPVLELDKICTFNYSWNPLVFVTIRFISEQFCVKNKMSCQCVSCYLIENYMVFIYLKKKKNCVSSRQKREFSTTSDFFCFIELVEIPLEGIRVSFKK